MPDLNGDGLDDLTGYANGVVYTGQPPTGFTYNGIPVYSNGEAYSGGSQSGTGGYASAGTQIPLDAATIAGILSGAQTDAAAQKATAAYQQGSLAQQGAATAQQAQASEQRHAEAMAQFQLQGQIAERQYQVDIKRLGIEGADLLYRQRLSQSQMKLQQATFGLDTAQFQLGQNQFNAQQRQAKAAAERDILDMLTKRSGPQDWVAYNNLLNGLDAPDPQATSTIDPMARLAGLYEESNVQAPQAPDLSFADVPVDTAMGAAASLPTFAGAGGASAGTGAVPIPQGVAQAASQPAQQAAQIPYSQPVNQAVPGGSSYSGVPLADLSKGWNFTTTGSAADFLRSDLDPSVKLYNTDRTEMTGQTVKKSTPYWFYKAAGGMKPGGMGGMGGGVLVGDNRKGTNKPSGKMTGHEEMVVNMNPEPDDLFMVLPHKQTKDLMSMAQHRAASGGTYGTGLNDLTVTANRYDPATLGNMPFVNKLRGKTPSREFGAFGATLSNPQLGIYDMPSQLNMQRFNALLPSEQDMTADLYQRGLTTDFRDLYESARRAAPFGRSNGPAFYGR